MAEIQSIGETPGVPVSVSNPDDIDAFVDDERESGLPPARLREGLPPGYRMRAEPHYVEALDGAHAPTPIRSIEVHLLDAPSRTEALSATFIDSVRRLGILQPLLVEPRGEGFHVLAGRRRLAAARAVGLRHVPCIVQRADDEQAALIAAATNLTASLPTPETIELDAYAWSATAAAGELSRALSSLMCCANLLSNPSTLTQAVSADLIHAEARRALDLLVAMRVLRDEMPIVHAPVSAPALLDRVRQAAAVERRLRGIELEVTGDIPAVNVRGDEELLTAALTAFITATASLLEGTALSRITLSASVSPRGALIFAVAQEAVLLPMSWLARAFVAAWPVRKGSGSLTLIQAAKKIGQAHGGDAVAETWGQGTRFALRLPVAESV